MLRIRPERWRRPIIGSSGDRCWSGTDSRTGCISGPGTRADGTIATSRSPAYRTRRQHSRSCHRSDLACFETQGEFPYLRLAWLDDWLLKERIATLFLRNNKKEKDFESKRSLCMKKLFVWHLILLQILEPVIETRFIRGSAFRRTSTAEETQRG